ncbi:MAG TPA: hypothetical protein VHA82_19540 [Ramlibacter sp.]|uniref:hypothetical protein n=1 Tax=Ramlibacter sp. TaxID=1917967 RepID=UPI002B9E4C57|nr:hypothetical protein [Ramlibacter sp.]HVZ46011.1 hypothetical protein [Ramlibacter sp.]
MPELGSLSTRTSVSYCQCQSTRGSVTSERGSLAETGEVEGLLVVVHDRASPGLAARGSETAGLAPPVSFGSGPGFAIGAALRSAGDSVRHGLAAFSDRFFSTPARGALSLGVSFAAAGIMGGAFDGASRDADGSQALSLVAGAEAAGGGLALGTIGAAIGAGIGRAVRSSFSHAASQGACAPTSSMPDRQSAAASPT